MCGRYVVTSSAEAIRRVFGVGTLPNFPPSYNVAPTQSVPIVRRAADGGRELVLVHWGLIPAWAKERSIGNRLINARAEGIADKPSFRAAYRARRCLVVADGFYEWRKLGGRKQPYLIRLRSGEPFAFAGLWESWRDPASGESVPSCTIITTTPNEAVAPLHDRMPVILPPERYDDWLDPSPGDADLLVPCPAEWLEVHPVSPRVNNPRANQPDLLAPLEAEEAAAAPAAG